MAFITFVFHIRIHFRVVQQRDQKHSQPWHFCQSCVFIFLLDASCDSWNASVWSFLAKLPLSVQKSRLKFELHVEVCVCLKLSQWCHRDDDSLTTFPPSCVYLCVCLIFIRWITLPTEPSSEARSTTTAPSRRSWLAWPCCSTSPRSEQLSTQPRASLISSADWKPVHFNKMLPHYTVGPVCSQF